MLLAFKALLCLYICIVKNFFGAGTARYARLRAPGLGPLRAGHRSAPSTRVKAPAALYPFLIRDTRNPRFSHDSFLCHSTKKNYSLGSTGGDFQGDFFRPDFVVAFETVHRCTHSWPRPASSCPSPRVCGPQTLLLLPDCILLLRHIPQSHNPERPPVCSRLPMLPMRRLEPFPHARTPVETIRLERTLPSPQTHSFHHHPHHSQLLEPASPAARSARRGLGAAPTQTRLGSARPRLQSNPGLASACMFACFASVAYIPHLTTCRPRAENATGLMPRLYCIIYYNPRHRPNRPNRPILRHSAPPIVTDCHRLLPKLSSDFSTVTAPLRGRRPAPPRWGRDRFQ